MYLIHYGPSILKDTALFLHPKVWQNDLQETKCCKNEIFINDLTFQCIMLTLQ